MKFRGILFIFSAVFTVITAENGEKKHATFSHHLHEKHLQSNGHQEKSFNPQHTINIHKMAAVQRRRHLKNFMYRDEHQNKNGSSIENSSGIQVFYNGNAGLVGTLNNSANIALIIDYNHAVAALLEGKTGAAVLIDTNTTTIYRILNNDTWSALKTSFESYFQSLPSLEPLVKLGQQGKDSYYNDKIDNVTNINPTLLQEINSDLISLGFPFSVESLNYIGKYEGHFKGVLSFLYRGSGSFTIHKSFLWFINLNFALAEILGNLEGGSQSLNLPLDLGAIFGSSSGVEALINFLSQIGRRVDLSKLLRNYLTSPESFLRLIAVVSRGSNDGLDGLITVLLNIMNAISGNGSFIEVINFLLNYEPTSEGSNNMSHIINEALDLIHSQNSLFNNSASFAGFVRILQALNNQNLVLNNINISDIIKILQFRNPRDVMQSIIKIMIGYISSPNFSQYVRYFTEFLNDTNGLGIVSRLFPGVDLNNLTNIINSGNFFQNILNTNFMQFISNNSNISFALSRFPIIGNFINEIPSSLRNQFNITRYLNISSILGDIQHPLEGSLTSFEQFISPFRNAASAIESGFSSALNSATGLVGSGVGGASGNSSRESSGSQFITQFSGKLGYNGSGLGYLNGSIPLHIMFKKENSHMKHNLHGRKDNNLHTKHQVKSEHNKHHYQHHN